MPSYIYLHIYYIYLHVYERAYAHIYACTGQRLDQTVHYLLGMTALVGLSFFFLLVSENMPASSNVPLIGGYYSVTMIQMGVSFFMNIFVLRFHHMTDEKVPDWVRVSTNI